MGKINIPFMRRYVGTLAHVTHVAEIALVHDLLVIGFIDAIHFHGVGFIHQVEQGWECLAEADTAPASMTDIIDTLELLVECIDIPEFFGLPVNRMPCWCFQAAFARSFTYRSSIAHSYLSCVAVFNLDVVVAWPFQPLVD